MYQLTNREMYEVVSALHSVIVLINKKLNLQVKQEYRDTIDAINDVHMRIAHKFKMATPKQKPQ